MRIGLQIEEAALRGWEHNDAPALALLANNSRIARFMTNQFPHPYPPDAAGNFITFARSHEPLRIFAIEFRGQLCGSIGLHPQSDIMCRNAELGYWVGEPFWGHGLATAAVKRVIDYGFAHLDIDRIFARPFGCNVASQRVLEKAGMQLEARFSKTIYKLGAYHDELFYAVRRQENC